MRKIVIAMTMMALAVVNISAEPVSLGTQPIEGAISVTAKNASTLTQTVIGGAVLSDAPNYRWHYGCSPTTAGAMIGYWDSKPGYDNMVAGDASTQTQAVDDMIASQQHITAGTENGYTYGTYENSASYPNHESNPDCLADFMHTVDGGTYLSNMSSGIENYIAWDNPSTTINESYQSTVQSYDDPYWGGTFSYDLLKNEIDADRPMMLNVFTYCEWEVDPSWYGHSIMAYGYQDNMFELFPAGGSSNIIVPGVAIMDTWADGTTYGSEWLRDTDGDNVPDVYYESYIDLDGVEWWPLLTDSDTNGYSYDNFWDWTVAGGLTLDVAVPEPTTICLFALAGLFLRKRK